jgi:cytochrome c-type biogenesis protein CcmH/NrfG
MNPTTVNEVEKHKRIQHYEVLRELGDCYTSVGNYSQAARCYEKAALLGPDEPGPYVGLGVAAIQRGALEDAEIAFRVACRLDPKCARAYTGLAMVAHQQRDFTRASGLYNESLDLDNDNVVTLLGFFQMSCETGSFDMVIARLETHLQAHPGDTRVMYALAASYLRAGRAEESKAALLNLLALDPDNIEAAHLLEVGRNA